MHLLSACQLLTSFERGQLCLESSTNLIRPFGHVQIALRMERVMRKSSSEGRTSQDRGI